MMNVLGRFGCWRSASLSEIPYCVLDCLICLNVEIYMFNVGWFSWRLCLVWVGVVF